MRRIPTTVARAFHSTITGTYDILNSIRDELEQMQRTRDEQTETSARCTDFLLTVHADMGYIAQELGIRLEPSNPSEGPRSDAEPLEDKETRVPTGSRLREDFRRVQDAVHRTRFEEVPDRQSRRASPPAPGDREDGPSRHG